jgi:ATP-binding cassette, subfamily B, bacterial
MTRKKFPHIHQLDFMDCGPVALKMVAKYYGRNIPLEYLRRNCFIEKAGVSLAGIGSAAERIGLRGTAVEAHYKALCEEATLPVIAFWRQSHFVVIYEIIKRGTGKKDIIVIGDPANTDLIEYDEDEFKKFWISGKSDAEEVGILLLLEPTPAFYEFDEYSTEVNLEGKLNRVSLKYLSKYIIPYKRYIIQLVLGLLAGSAISLTLPFLTQSLVDFGVNNQDIDFVYAILLAQLSLFIGTAFIEVIRKWILLTISLRINITLVSDYLAKLLRLSLGYFDSKNTGDIIQRIHDHDRIEAFLTTSSLDVVFSLFNIVIFSFVLAIYNILILSVFLVGTVFYVIWISFFLKKRRVIDFKLFNQISNNKTTEIELIQGIQEIKLNNCEQEKRWQWESVQAELYKVKKQNLVLEIYQSNGSSLINQLKNIVITFLAAKSVIEGNITFGMMMSITFIIGQLNAPILNLIDIIKKAQDASISLERIGEVHNSSDENENLDESIDISETENIEIKNVYFRYGNPHKPWVLDNLSLTIPHGKTTAIVGPSGSGKTTLVKLLLKFYKPENGSITIGNTPLDKLNGRVWRNKCGAVMQDGYIFADTIARNIAVAGVIDKKKLVAATEIARIRDYIEYLPINYNTMIGMKGIGMSGGQKQRILIARAIYKNPDLIIFDEATSALDAENELAIAQNLSEFSKNRTTVIIAHRLSTVKNADQIIVIDKGRAIERGTHAELTAKKGMYFHLVKNQLELGV